MLWAFDIRPENDASGEPIIPDQEQLTQGFVCMPEEFPASFVARSEGRASIIKAEWESAEKESLHPQTKQWIDSPL